MEARYVLGCSARAPARPPTLLLARVRFLRSRASAPSRRRRRVGVASLARVTRVLVSLHEFPAIFSRAARREAEEKRREASARSNTPTYISPISISGNDDREYATNVSLLRTIPSCNAKINTPPFGDRALCVIVVVIVVIDVVISFANHRRNERVARENRRAHGAKTYGERARAFRHFVAIVSPHGSRSAMNSGREVKRRVSTRQILLSLRSSRCLCYCCCRCR